MLAENIFKDHDEIEQDLESIALDRNNVGKLKEVKIGIMNYAASILGPVYNLRDNDYISKVLKETQLSMYPERQKTLERLVITFNNIVENFSNKIYDEFKREKENLGLSNHIPFLRKTEKNIKEISNEYKILVEDIGLINPLAQENDELLNQENRIIKPEIGNYIQRLEERKELDKSFRKIKRNYLDGKWNLNSKKALQQERNHLERLLKNYTLLGFKAKQLETARILSNIKDHIDNYKVISEDENNIGVSEQSQEGNNNGKNKYQQKIDSILKEHNEEFLSIRKA